MASDNKITALLTVNSAQLNAQKITNNLLSDVLNAQIKTNGLLGAQNAIARKRVSADKFASQESAIEKFRKQKKSSGLKDKVKLPGKIDWKKALGVAGLATAVGLLAGSIANAGGLLNGIANVLDGAANGIEQFEIQLREGARKVREFLTPIEGFSMFGLRQASMGVDAAKSGRYATTGGKVRGAVGRGILKGAKATVSVPARAIKGAGNLALDGVEAGLSKVAGANTAALADKLDDIAIRQGARARSTTLATGLTPKTLRDSIVSAVKTTRERAAGFVGTARQGAGRGLDAIKAAPGNLNTQRKLFMQGITGADDVSVLRTAGRPFPNVARGAGSLADEVGGFFRTGRGIRTGVQSAVGNVRGAASATRQAVSAATPQGVKQFMAVSKAAGPQAAILGTFDDIVKNLKNLKVKTITSLGSALKALPGQFATLGKSLKGFAGGIKTAVANFDLGKAAIQVSKVGSRGAQGLARGAAGVVRGAPGAASKLAQTISRARAPVMGPAPPPGLLGKTGNMLKGGAGAAVKGTGSIVKRIPILGSLISAGFGALEANNEEMERLRAENPQMDDEQIKAGLADGTLKKDKAKIIGRSAGAGAGAGVGTVVGGILGSALGPIGTALGAAAGAWLGENVGKFLGEGFANTFKSFNWGETFGPVITSFKELAGSITGALDTVAAAFGIGGTGEGGSGGFLEVLKNIGRIIGIIAKLLMKVLAPVLQIVAKYYKALIDIAAKIISTIGTVVKGGLQLVKGLVDKVPGWLGGDALRNMLSGVEGAFEGDVIGNISSFVDGMDLSLPNAEGAEGSGDDKGIPGRKKNPTMPPMGGGGWLNPFNWGKKVDEARDNATINGNAFGYNNRYKNVTDPNMRRMLGLPEGGQGGVNGRSGFQSRGGQGGQGGGGYAPVLTSGFGWRDMDQDGRKEDNHMGIDIAAPQGTPLVAFDDGVVQTDRAVGYLGGYGNTVIWNDSKGRAHLWAHMMRPAKVRMGQRIKKGDVLGYVGNTGRSTGPHLHWEVSTNPADVGQPKSSPGTRGDARSLGYDWKAPFSGKSSGTDSLPFVSSNNNSSSNSSSLASAPLTSMMRSSSSGFRSLAERTQAMQTNMQSQGVEAGIAGALASALAPLGNLRQSLMEAVSAGRPAVASAGSDNSSVASDGDVSMFPTSSPVRDGGHVFAGDV